MLCSEHIQCLLLFLLRAEHACAAVQLDDTRTNIVSVGLMGELALDHRY